MAFFSLNRDGPDIPGLADPEEVQLFVLSLSFIKGPGEAAWVCLASCLHPIIQLLITFALRAAAAAIVFTVLPWRPQPIYMVCVSIKTCIQMGSHLNIAVSHKMGALLY